MISIAQPAKSKLLRCLLFSILICLLGALAFILPVSATTSCGGVETSIIECNEGGSGGIKHILILVLDTLTIGIGIAGVVGISVAGVQYLTAGSSEEKTLKAKRRIYEIVIGIACYALIYGIVSFVSTSNPGEFVNTNDPGKISIASAIEDSTGRSFTPKVTFSSDAIDTTYSLQSSDSTIAKALGSSVKCVGTGNVTIRALSSNGDASSMKLSCKKPVNTNDDDDNDSSSSSGSSSGSSTKRSSAGSKKAPDGSIAASDGSPTVGSQKNTKLNGSPNMRKDTKKIIEDHNTDFFWYNYEKVLKKKYDGSYIKYVQSLKNKDGSDSVFSAYASRVNSKGNIKYINVKTAADLQAAAEYVWGLWAIWGIDYSNGTYDHHPYWGDPSDEHIARDKTAYHYGQPGRADQIHYTPYDNINTNLTDPEARGIGCNMAINIFYLTTNLTRIHGSGGNLTEFSQQNYHKNGGVITKGTELAVGDILHMKGSITHVAMVGEVYKDYVVIYDGGSLFQYNKNYKYKIPRRANNSLSGTVYSYYSYFNAYRVWDIDQSVTLKGIN